MGLLAKMFKKDSSADTKTRLVTSKLGPPPKPTPTTTIQEKSDKISWAIWNWKALDQTGTKTIKSRIFPIYFTGGRNGYDKVVHRLRIVCKPQYSNVDGSIEAMNLKLETIDNGDYDYVNDARSTKTEGHFRFETVDESIQITIVDDKSGTTQSQFFKDGNPRAFGICDAKDVSFQMTGLSSPNFEVTLFFKILHFTEVTI